MCLFLQETHYIVFPHISDDKVSWHDKKRDRMKVPVADLFVFAIRRCSHAYGYMNKFKVTGYTTYIIK